MTTPNRIHLRGFASLSPERRKAIASLGGKTAQAEGRCHRWTVEEAMAAGRKGAQQRLARQARTEREA